MLGTCRLKEHVVGTLNPDGSMKKTVVYGDTMERDATQIPKCRDHIYLPSCAGGCICKAYWQEGTYHAPGCGTENFLLPDKVRMYVETLNLKEKPVFSGKDMELQIIEGKQKPTMSHCYVLV
jgi:radical SAM protein with 4Fe4S-binding SPASM domain